MLFQVLILVCAAALPHADCQPETALDIIQGPDAPNEIMCGFHGQAYVASTAIGTHLHPGEYVKVRCQRTGIGYSVG